MNDIPWSKLTHAIQFKAYPVDSSGAIAGISGADADQFTSAAHANGVKALVCIGDNNGDTHAFSAAAAANLNALAGNIADFVNAHNYDGVDLDWEASNYRPGSPDRANYINLISLLRSALGPDKLITIAVYWDNGLEGVVQAVQGQLNQVNVMCYDMDQWISWTYHNDSTYGDPSSSSCAAEAGQFASYIPAAKIGLGIPFYGRIWSGCADAACSDGLHAPGQSWSGTPSQKTIYYRDLVNSPYWPAQHVWDAARGAEYVSIDQPGAAGDRFISFTGIPQINEIVRFGRSQGYGGYMVYELEYDFLAGASGDARHPLASAVYTAVKGASAVPALAAPPALSSPPPPPPAATARATGMSVTPDSGSGSGQIFVFQVPLTGAAGLSRVDVLFGWQTVGINSCSVIYHPATNSIDLMSDDGMGWTHTLLGNGSVLSNSQCSVDGGASSATVSGNTLALALRIDFTAYSGQWNIFGQTTDSAGDNTGWLAVGSWSVP